MWKWNIMLSSSLKLPKEVLRENVRLRMLNAMIDVYQVLNMSMVGTLAYRSILNGSNAVKIPDFKIKEDRDLWRNDNHSTDALISFGEDLLPSCKSGFVDVSDEVYHKVFEKFNNVPLRTGMQ